MGTPAAEIYLQADIPPGMTCEEYRRRLAGGRRRLSRVRRLIAWFTVI